MNPSWEELKMLTEKLLANGLLRKATGACFPLSSWAPTTAPGIQITFEGEWRDAGPMDCLEGGMLNFDASGHRKVLFGLPQRNNERLRLPSGREFASIPEAAAYFEASYANLRPESGYATLISVSGELSRVEVPESGNFNNQQQLVAELLDSPVNGVRHRGLPYGAFGNQHYDMLLNAEDGEHVSRGGHPEVLTRTLNPVATALWHDAYNKPGAFPHSLTPSHLLYGPVLLLQDFYYPFDKHILAQANNSE
jgi:hypothetical protein